MSEGTESIDRDADATDDATDDGTGDDGSLDIAELIDLDEPDGGSDRTLVVVLAAGAGSRFSGDTHKLEAMLGERTVAEHAIIAAIASGVGNVVVITGSAQPSAAVMSQLAGATAPHETGDETTGVAVDPSSETVQFIHHPQWADGQATSLQVAIAEAERTDVDAVVVGLADQPGVLPEAWQRVAASKSPIAVATYGDQRGNPVRLHRSMWHLLPTEGDEGARTVMQLHPELVEQIPCPGSANDIDTREDLQLWQSKSSTSSP